MPAAPRSVCSSPNCFRLAPSGQSRCEEHHAEWVARRSEQSKQAHKAYNARRPATDKFYWTNTWKRKSETYREAHPLCEECESLGLVVESKMVDHIIPYRLRPDLGLVDSNLRALCWQCHNRIGAKVRAEEEAAAAAPAAGARTLHLRTL